MHILIMAEACVIADLFLLESHMQKHSGCNRVCGAAEKSDQFKNLFIM